MKGQRPVDDHDGPPLKVSSEGAARPERRAPFLGWERLSRVRRLRFPTALVVLVSLVPAYAVIRDFLLHLAAGKTIPAALSELALHFPLGLSLLYLAFVLHQFGNLLWEFACPAILKSSRDEWDFRDKLIARHKRAIAQIKRLESSIGPMVPQEEDADFSTETLLSIAMSRVIEQHRRRIAEIGTAWNRVIALRPIFRFSIAGTYLFAGVFLTISAALTPIEVTKDLIHRFTQMLS